MKNHALRPEANRPGNSVTAGAALRRPSPYSFAFQRGVGFFQNLTLGGVGNLPRRFRQGEPPRLLDFMIVPGYVALAISDQIKIYALENPDGFALLVLVRVPIGDITQFCNDFSLEA